MLNLFDWDLRSANESTWGIMTYVAPEVLGEHESRKEERWSKGKDNILYDNKITSWF